ncbi:YccF domain-containing protein [Kangiella sediminilitoris]|uniref:Inner membrane protein YccF n=1 Tax=Kangiella sediminilitoris TaxID=1144748 RepID=A0A1B3B7Y9_9GAMM|nr:YccF domain-containing protein [Kangiella sediminilitoris]AOE48908.1 membrane protein [Kangiella sediminilitoris]
MSLLLNIIWLIFGGFFVSMGYIAGGIALCFTIIGIPWGFQCFKLAIFALFPFGQDTRMRDRPAPQDLINIILNIIWLIFGGIWVMINHIFWGVVLCITIIGIPFGIQHFKMVKLALWPFGRQIYSTNGDSLF